MNDDNQSYLSFRLSTVPASPAFSYRDALGNWVLQVNILPVTSVCEAESVVLTHDATATTSFVQLGESEQRQEELQEEFYDILAASKYVPRLPELCRSSPKRKLAVMAPLPGSRGARPT